jgi:hypothetical protein
MNEITIENNGDKIIGSNFWDNQEEEDFYLSWIDKTARLLVVAPAAQTIKEIEFAQEVIITQGTSTLSGNNAYEILFEDGSDTPFVLILDEQKQSDKKIKEVGKEKMRLTLWEKDKMLIEFPMSFRKKETLPYMEK